MPAITGEEYKKRIGAMKSEVWLDGKMVEGPITEHHAFRGAIQTQAELYDLQHDQKISETMTFSCEKTGNKIGASFMIPKSTADLVKRRSMIQEWARHSGGLMGRSPDYMNTVLASFAASVDVLEGEENCYPDRLLRFYESAREKDWSFTHTFINPQSNRSKLAFLEEDVTNARIIKRLEQGLVIKGAKLLATQGGMTDEILVFSAPGAQERCHAYGFSIPCDTPGLKFVCRQSFTHNESSYNAPLSSRYEEMDTIVIFDEVLVPWDRVFLHDNIKAANQFYTQGKFVPFTLHQIVSRQIIKTELLLGIANHIVETINISEYQHVQSKVVEIIKGLESMKALLHYAESNAETDEAGIVIPSRKSLYVAVNQFQELYPRFTEIIQLLGASGMMTIPHEADFKSSIGEQLDHFLQGVDRKGEERVRLFRLAWDMTMSSFGSRQTLYERFFFGDPVRLSQAIYQIYDHQPSMHFAAKIMKKKS
ncbi:4-hydroxyphenylacetate 3-monooxygenase, oxygenase component [Halobacillus yeomjeoni]|uniref:4-hydroxyphenylacetate 3-monooxygenase, oxygenase component n=1 Tax=Halobacillus yeomjeoni TaxID=311194 RepID=UPI001CD4CB46|nr:4-hydroxyphenylacetate 3-monooxygenase, oxygenase component [Halobacillus yeomjeoni]MCA0984574.1 4-hydroxyphenylacetate 3-monooxygenase, oxygenase component [Halobacillus yeomjeoni]